MLEKDLSNLNESDILEFFQSKAPESNTLEYKRELGISAGDERKEFLADISAFANSSGGVILYGISEKEGVPDSVDGIEVENSDNFILLIENIIRDGIKPRIDYSLVLVSLTSRKFVLVIKVRESLIGPHGVISNKHYKFYARNNGGKYELDIEQLRNIFVGSSTLVERIRDFRTNRIFDIEAGKAQIPLFGKSKIIMHLIPRESFTSSFSLTDERVKLIKNDPQYRMKPPYWDRAFNSPMVNFDGYISWSGDREENIYNSYTQIYRNGVIEGTEARLLNNRNLIPSSALENEIIIFIQRSLSLYRDLGVNPPIYVFITITNIKDQRLHIKDIWRDNMSDPISQNDLLLPEVIIDNYSADIPGSIRKATELIWNAAGTEQPERQENDNL